MPSFLFSPIIFFVAPDFAGILLSAIHKIADIPPALISNVTVATQTFNHRYFLAVSRAACFSTQKTMMTNKTVSVNKKL
jgi:hypothetical protein